MDKVEQLNFLTDATPASGEFGVIACSILLAAELQGLTPVVDVAPEEYKTLTRKEREEQERYIDNLFILDWKLDDRQLNRGESEPDVAKLDPYELFRADCNFRKFTRSETAESLRKKRDHVQATLEGIFDVIAEVELS